MYRIENTMVTGWGKPDEAMLVAFGNDPVYRCERCKYELHANATVYNWDGEWFCEDCMNDAVMSMSPADRADVVGESVAYSEQMVEMARTYEDLADLMHIEKSVARREL